MLWQRLHIKVFIFRIRYKKKTETICLSLDNRFAALQADAFRGRALSLLHATHSRVSPVPFSASRRLTLRCTQLHLTHFFIFYISKLKLFILFHPLLNLCHHVLHSRAIRELRHFCKEYLLWRFCILALLLKDQNTFCRLFVFK